MEKVFERSYGSHLSMQGAEEHFFDCLIDEMKSRVKEERVIERDYINDIYESDIVLEDGRELNIEISLWEFEDSETDEKEYEWNCFAYKK